jgi:protocatechuate 3,4-dioxygenase beta subunit
MRCPTPAFGSRTQTPLATRRHILIGFSTALIGGRCLAREPLTRRGTPQLTTGPFYPLKRPFDQDSDLTRIPGQAGVARGVIMDLHGKVTTESGKPLAGAILDVWQTNGFGRYHHRSDETGLPYDPNFQGSAVVHADGDGAYRLRTIVPLPYERRQRHIHFDIRGEHRRLVTQMFFPGEPNERDTLYPALGNEVLQQAVTARLIGEEGGVKQFRWDIIVAGE